MQDLTEVEILSTPRLCKYDQDTHFILLKEKTQRHGTS